MYKIDVRVLGMVGTNCYLLCNTDTKECVLIDPADNAGKISEMIEQSGCTLKGILLTHGHFDHIMAADEVRDKYNVKVYASAEEKNTLSTPHINLGEAYGMNLSVKADIWHNDGDVLNLAGLILRQSIHRDIRRVERAIILSQSACYSQVIHFFVSQLVEQISQVEV